MLGSSFELLVFVSFLGGFEKGSTTISRKLIHQSLGSLGNIASVPSGPPPLWCENSPHFGCVLELVLLTFGTLVVARALPDHKRIPFFLVYAFSDHRHFPLWLSSKRNNAAVRSVTASIFRGFGCHEFATARARFLTTNIF